MSYVSKCTLILSTCQWLHTGGGSENLCVCGWGDNIKDSFEGEGFALVSAKTHLLPPGTPDSASPASELYF